MCYYCKECSKCKEGSDNICEGGITSTCNGHWPKTGETTYGGYANKWRGDAHWAFKVPDNMTSEDAACFFCAGVTCYAPFVRANASPKTTIGVLSIGKYYYIVTREGCTSDKLLIIFPHINRWFGLLWYSLCRGYGCHCHWYVS